MLARTLPAVTDWRGLRDAALEHGVAAILYRLIVESGSTATPPEQLESLHALTAANEHRSLRMGMQLLRIVEQLSREGIDALPVKGPVMAEALYGDAGLRHSVDLEFALESPEHGLVIDLHWRLGPRFAHASLPVEDLMANAGTTTFLGRDLLTLSREDLFAVMCVHGAHNHRWNELELVAALGAWGAAAARSDWLPLLDRAARLGCLRRCIIGCLLMREVTGVALPAEAEARIARDALAARLACVAREGLFAEGLRTAAVDGLGGIIWESLALDRPGLMPGHFVARVLTPGTRDWESGRIPSRLPGLYYLSRPLRLALGRFGRGGSA